MHPLIESINERPLSHKVAIWVGTIVFMTFIFWQYFYSNLLTEKEELDGKLEKLSTEVSHERRLARDLNKFREEVKGLDIKLRMVLRELPDKREIPDLLDSISTLATQAGLDVVLFRPLPETFRDFYAEVPVSVAVEGTFHQIAVFFDEVAHLSRIVNINRIGIKDPQITEDRVTVKADCIATTFRYLEESERITAPQESDAKRRKRK